MPRPITSAWDITALNQEESHFDETGASQVGSYSLTEDTILYLTQEHSKQSFSVWSIKYNAESFLKLKKALGPLAYETGM